MANNTELKQRIDQRIQAFANQSLRKAALSLFSALGYESDRTVETTSVADFRAQFDPESRLAHPAALVANWKSAELLFQLTDEELSSTTALFKDESVKTSLLQSYIFIAIELADGDYARGKLAGIARQINRIFPMPVMVLFKIGCRLSIAVINRRLNKRDDNKDVLGKVTLIQNIAIENPHPGHIDILASFSLAELTEGRRVIQNFDQLHAAWEEVFNVELLNKRFYRELSNWYFWALPQVDFPADIEKDDEKRCATGLIRLLTRLIFCWFLKEKGLVPEKLFAETDLKNILKDLSPNASTYNEAILQNLFFATLNQRMGKDKNGRPFRAFATDEGFQKNRATYGVDTLYRYEDHFRDPATALEHFADVPFLNGGLFECLDRIEDGTGKKLYLDGFSRNKKKRPTIPNHLFFGGEHEEDLSGAYGDTKRKREKVRGLLHILNAYKFTIVENTPVDQEIALDPELLGKVFENLLASYNEETKTTARKQTGSFYTPRPIVEYMVDESLKAHLTGALAKAGMCEQNAKAGLDILFAYTERAHPFNENEVATLLDAIHTCKILDPACGSGAFPMGVLHKLVYIIHKLDPDNGRWKQLQIDAAAKIPDVTARDAAIAAIERDFADNEDDYGRKLYLIENCLYGVDIQPIAIQISKLRFFISLVCDQRTNRSKKDNHGIRPLPNLETKFVAADTLIGLPEMDQLALLPSRVHEIEGEIEELYHRHFAIQRRDQKLALQKKIKSLREELGKVLAESLGSSKKAQHIADWNPFDPQASSDFFDPYWMFGQSLADGFDVVLGNPPYQSAIEHKKARGGDYRDRIKEQYASTTGTWDLYIPFFEAGIHFLKPNGILSYISPNKFLSATYGIGLRQYLLRETRILTLADVSHLPVFESASVYPVISVFKKNQTTSNYPFALLLPLSRESQFSADEYSLGEQDSGSLTLLPDNLWGFLLSPNLEVLKVLLNGCETLDDVARVRATTTAAEAEELGATLRASPASGWKTLNTGTIDPFSNQWASEPLRHQGQIITKPILPDGPKVSQNRRELYSSPKLIVAKMALGFEGFVDQQGEYAALNCNCVSEPSSNWTLDAIALVLHSRVVAFAYKQYFDGLRMSGGYLPFQAPQLKIVPVPKIQNSAARVLDALGRLRAIFADAEVDSSVRTFLGDLSEACVMECYFRDHMAERDLLFLDDLAPHLAAYKPEAPQAQQREFTIQLYRTLNESSSKIRNRLLRIPADSPDLLAVIQREGAA
ncbi:MAG: Eco57I restriction-modification methylase domain-containing protein [Zoogloea oleivorans]|jgi:type I restriction-modification system DNA methylase subunit|uniref:Eco57I restriction-modification methylase domain-containing protein n=1 Tax=Zoogloea oleivorans TaxID=1552750 RepID=UPI002A36E06E|nr:Eco57I restriction-modification methylase domain-containing protein [Zoogloea oleivorans]MDY0037986.1 Eco57I restriction-modification methylase domain-containing protein [Zoogloea oleivorans]